MNETTENNESLNDVANNNAAVVPVIENQKVVAPPENSGVYSLLDNENKVAFSKETETVAVAPEIKVDDSDFNSDKNKKGLEMIQPMGFFSRNKKILTIILLVAFIFSLSANGAGAYFVLNKNKTIKSQQATIDTQKEEAVKQKEIIDTASNCPVVAPVAETPVAATPTPTTTTKKSTSSSQESVIAPPPPPSD